jgi:hypothetical protein
MENMIIILIITTLFLKSHQEIWRDRNNGGVQDVPDHKSSSD